MAFLLLANPGVAQVKPGDFITPDNAAKVRDLVSPGVYYKVLHGMTMKIVPTQRIDWPPPYKDATEKYSEQVRLSPDRRSLVGYVAGQPFPVIDPNDPDVAIKIIWNGFFRPLATDDYDLRFYDCESVYEHGSGRALNYVQIGHHAGYGLVGRTEVEPLPIDPDFTKTNRLWVFAHYPLLSPQNARGAGFIRWRYADPRRGDDDWAFAPGPNRVRRLNESFLSTATATGSAGANTWDPDHFPGFIPKIEEYTYRFLGEKDMLASVHAEHSPEVKCATDGGASACPEAWEMRHLYVVEMTPDRARISGALEGRTIIYMDSEVWFEPYVDTYDRKGQLWRNHINWLTYRDRPVPGARVAIYPFKREFVVASSSTDVQDGVASMCYLPGRETPERECWYINMGAVDRNFFTTDALVHAAIR